MMSSAPWLVQIGYRRAGWYSYDLLEAVLMAADFVDGRSAERIIPELQNLAVDDRIFITREIGFRVAQLIAGRALILQGRGSLPENAYFELSDPLPDAYVNLSWVFFLENTNSGYAPDYTLALRLSRAQKSKSLLRPDLHRTGRLCHGA